MQFKGIFIGGTTKCIKSISAFSLSTQHPYRKKQTILLPKVASFYLMTVPVVELPGMYAVPVDLMNSVLYLLYLRLELSGHLSKTVELTSMPN